MDSKIIQNNFPTSKAHGRKLIIKCWIHKISVFGFPILIQSYLIVPNDIIYTYN